jgi:hypothetical protein
LIVPGRGGDTLTRLKLSFDSIDKIPQILSSFSTKNKKDFNQRFDYLLVKPKKNKLEELFRYYGSDKCNNGFYSNIYYNIFKEISNVKKIFEIGIGTTNRKIISNMGKSGKPGASLKAFRDFLPKTRIFGADTDRRILFKENFIETFYLDQTKLETFVELNKKISSDIDLCIDDGLHSVHSNLNSLNFFLGKIKKNSFVVIEDLLPIAEPIWYIISSILSKNYVSGFLTRGPQSCFILKKL